MVKRKKEKIRNLCKNPYMYYITNWGFAGSRIEKLETQTKN